MIKFNNIFLRYNGRTIFQNFSVEIKQGDKAVLFGKSGSGKSSLFGLCLGFIEPGGGEILFGGTPVDEKTAWHVRKKAAYIDQDVSIGSGKGIELIQFVSSLKANSSLDVTKSRIIDLLDYFELEKDIIYKDIRELSGGERQRFAIVISILLDRAVFFLDEVTSALDAHFKEKVVEYFTTRENWTCLAASHDSVWLDHPVVKIFDMEAGAWKQ